LRRQSARWETKNRRFTGRHVHNHKRRSLRVALRHADSESSAERHPRHAQNHAAPSRRRRESGSSPDDVSRPELRSSRHRWQRSRDFSHKTAGLHRRTEKVAVRFLRVLSCRAKSRHLLLFLFYSERFFALLRAIESNHGKI